MKTYLKIVLFGFLIWLIPFIVGFAFYDQTGNLTVDQNFFKSVMSAILAIVTAFFCIKHLKTITSGYKSEAIKIGLIWFVTNLILDLIVLVPMSKMKIGDYFLQIGIAYIAILAITFMSGVLLESKKQ